MAQEDNNLNARVAVASTRDSSSMKALAVIAAVFLPGTYIATLFSMSMFDWQAGVGSSSGGNQDKQVVMPLFWVYWVIAVVLTVLIIFAWRYWWVSQDRDFRMHLSKEIADDRYWTPDGSARELDTTFLQDFFHLSNRHRGGHTDGSVGASRKRGLGEEHSQRTTGFRRELTPNESVSGREHSIGKRGARRE